MHFSFKLTQNANEMKKLKVYITQFKGIDCYFLKFDK
jgi:hypothetical protein